MRRGARSALGVGLALAVMAASGAWAEVRAVDADECPGTCIAAATHELAVGEEESAAGMILSRSGSGAGDSDFSLIFDRNAMPAALADGLPSPLTSASAEDPEARDVSAYDFFAGVIDLPHSADARAFAAASLFSFTPLLASRRTLTDVLWASQAFFEPRSNDVASRLAMPLPVDAGSQPTRRGSTLTPSLSDISGPPSGEIWDQWSCTWTRPVSDPWQPSSGPC